MTRSAAVERTLTTLRFLGTARRAGTGRHRLPEASTTTSSTCRRADAFGGSASVHRGQHALLAGAIAAAMYFDADSAKENEIRTPGDAFYRRADWAWRKTVVTRSPMAGSRRAASRTDGRRRGAAVVRVGLARQRIHCRAELHGLGLDLPLDGR